MDSEKDMEVLLYDDLPEVSEILSDLFSDDALFDVRAFVDGKEWFVSRVMLNGEIRFKGKSDNPYDVNLWFLMTSGLNRIFIDIKPVEEGYVLYLVDNDKTPHGTFVMHDSDGNTTGAYYIYPHKS